MAITTNHPFACVTNWTDLSNLWSRGVPVWEAAYRLEVTKGTVRRLIEEGELPAIKMGNSWRIVPDSLEEIVARRHLYNGEHRELTLTFRLTRKLSGSPS